MVSSLWLKCSLVPIPSLQYYSVQWSPSIMDTTGTKDFVLYSEVSFAQGVIVDHAPLTIVASYAGARLWIMNQLY